MAPKLSGIPVCPLQCASREGAASEEGLGQAAILDPG